MTGRPLLPVHFVFFPPHGVSLSTAYWRFFWSFVVLVYRCFEMHRLVKRTNVQMVVRNPTCASIAQIYDNPMYFFADRLWTLIVRVFGSANGLFFVQASFSVLNPFH